MAKDERNGNLLERPRTRLPDENLRFADDVMLFATSKEQIRNMMCEFKKATEKVGTQDAPRQDENSQQPEQHEFRHKKIY